MCIRDSCSDVKRKVLYIKNEEGWEKDKQHEKITKCIKNVEYKHTFWAQLYQKGMLHAPHHHGEDDISWVHFLNVPEEKLFRFTDTDGNVFVPKEQNNGDIICFPSWLWHEVLPNETDEERLVTAGNIKITNLL